MIDFIKNLFRRDKSIELKMLEIIQQQQDFIAKNINERVVYVDQQSGYTNVDRFDEKSTEEDIDPFEDLEDMTAEDLRDHMEGLAKESDKQ